MIAPVIDRSLRRLNALSEESPLAGELARLASLAVRVDPGLLRALRLQFLRASDPGIESDLWFSGIVESRGPTGFQIAPEVLAVLRESLAKDSATLRAVRRLTRAVHARVSPAILLEEEVNGLALEKGDDAGPDIDRAVRPVLRTLAAGGDTALDIARWALRAGARLHWRVRQNATVQTLVQIASLKVGRRVFRAAARPELRFEEMAWAGSFGTDWPLRSFHAQFVEGGLQFVESPDGGLALPATDPLVVEMAWTVTRTEHRQTLEVVTGVVLELDAAVQSLTLTTLLGTRYLLTRSDAPAQATATLPALPSAYNLGACFQVMSQDGAPLCLALRLRNGIAVAPAHAVQHQRSVLLGSAEWEVLEPQSGSDLARLVPRRSPDAYAHDGVRLAGPDTAMSDLAVAVWGASAPTWYRARASASRASPGVHDLSVFDVPFEIDDTRRPALIGAPVARGEEIVGLVLDVRPNASRSDAFDVQFAVVDQLRKALDAPRERAVEVRLKVYVSALPEPKEYREAARRAVISRGHEPVLYNPDDLWTKEEITRLIDSVDAFVGIVGVMGNKYHDDLEREYSRAVSRGLSVLMFLEEEEEKPGPKERYSKEFEILQAQAFRDEVRKRHKVATFTNSHDLETKIAAALSRLDPERSPDPEKRPERQKAS